MEPLSGLERMTQVHWYRIDLACFLLSSLLELMKEVSANRQVLSIKPTGANIGIGLVYLGGLSS